MEQAKRLDPRAALERLVARHPSVAADPQIAALLREGYQEPTGVVTAVQKLLLRPNLTVAVVGCFRSQLLDLIEGLLHTLRHLWLQGTSSADGHAMEVEPSPFDGFDKSMRWSLGLHEYAVMAFSRVLELAPFTLSILLQYFSFAPAPFERLLLANRSSAGDTPPVLDLLRACYRYLILEPKTFRNLWDWSPFLDLLQWKAPKDLSGSQPEVGLDVRWCSIQVLSVVLRMSDATTRGLSSKVSELTEEDCFACLMRWEAFSLEISVEKAGMYFEPVTGDDMTCDVESSVFQTDRSSSFEDFVSVVRWRPVEGATFVEICGVQLPLGKEPIRRGIMASSESTFVLTSTVKKNLESVVLALSQKLPILLEGPSGSGKSMLIQELANTTGNSDVVFIHLDDQMESKTLLGSYVCTEIPGEFKWQPGALTQAVLQGLWVVIEDIDRAPFEILSALVPLLEDRKLYIAGRGEMIYAAENFQIFSTVTQTKFGTFQSSTSGGKDMLGTLWRKVVIDAPSDAELAVIIKAQFPMLSFLVAKLIGTLNTMREIASQSTVEVDGVGIISIHIGRQFSTRDLVKWCRRISVLGSQCYEGSHLSSYVRERIYVEAIDCFAGSISSFADRQLVMTVIAEQWEIPLERVDFFSKRSKPSLQLTKSSVQVGRTILYTSDHQDKSQPTRIFAPTQHAMRMLESISTCVQQREPILLVGETGTGKTSLVQFLARWMSVPLVVLNLSQQSDSVDLLGGYKPVEAPSVCIPLYEMYRSLFRETFPVKKNAELMEKVGNLVVKKRWEKLLQAFRATVSTVAKHLGSSLPLDGNQAGRTPGENPEEDSAGKVAEEPASKRMRQLNNRILEKWRKFSRDLSRAERQVESAKTAFAFSFVEGALVKALRKGHWILLDEVNLAPTETLERLTGVLEGERGCLCLTERGDVESIEWHPDFRIFACMNPATDVGKRDLPFSLKSRLTEFHVDELTNKEDLQALVYQYLEGTVPAPPVEDIVDFYLFARQEADARLLDGAHQKPHYSLRSLARALEYAKAAMPTYGFQRSLYDGICMAFLTLLDRPSALIMEQLILRAVFKQTGIAATKLLKSILKVPSQPTPRHVLFEQFWVECGDAQPNESSLEVSERYVLTSSIREHLKNLARAVFIRKSPILLQGPTSSGKTSLIEHLAIRTRHLFVRINNHEHTDLQEYLGSYVTDRTGKLVFQEGILVQAVRKGYWIVLDELNLAPSDVLEALNRLLDDNRELFVPELQVMIKPHPHFMLFATQNPPGIYGGRKVLSRAFRNRFIELHVDDIPDEELQAILEKRCQIPGSYAGKMVEVMKDLQRHRQGSKVFAGKHGFITPRDLFRWAERHANGYEELAWDGYMLLAERLRNADEKAVVQQTLERHMRVKIKPDQLHGASCAKRMEMMRECRYSPEDFSPIGKIVWTKSMTRLFNLVERCMRHNEPVLLVGDTGCGKTTVCQLMAVLLRQKLHILNCHQHSETADFIGGLRPVRDRDSIASKYAAAIKRLVSAKLLSEHITGELSSRVKDAESTLKTIRQALSKLKSSPKSHRSRSGAVAGTNGGEMQGARDMVAIESELLDLQREYQSLFLWHDGPLVNAMRNGDIFLIDEVSLADDSVLERLNSVLEPKRLLVLAEKGGSTVEEIVAHESFRLLATMNPGGDFGKRELSPALRNRFTEIWVPPIEDLEDLQSIVADRFGDPELLSLMDPLLQFWQWFQHHGEKGRSLSVRDLLSWVNFVNVTWNDIGATFAYVHGAFLVLLDGIGFGTGMSIEAMEQLRNRCLEHLLQQLPEGGSVELQSLSRLQADKSAGKRTGHLPTLTVMNEKVLESSFQVDKFGIHPFYIARGKQATKAMTFALTAPTTSWNALRILRAMQLSKPVLLEGSPGVGKTSLVSALATSSDHPLVRINLSEQTDVMDLFGSDMPVEGGKSGEFRWSDGVFLQALKAGSWVLLDELNLASQSVLEGLNACLDHRGEIFIPELGQVFKCPDTFRVFACQNPVSEGGGRKGLPKSFLNRFTKVFVDALSEDDYLFIARTLHPSIPESTLQRMVHFNARLHEDTMVTRAYGHVGSPWEFNLRDILRWCDLIEENRGHWSQKTLVECFLDVVYLQRMRTKDDRHHVICLFNEVFGTATKIETHPIVTVTPQSLNVGEASLQRQQGMQLEGDIFGQTHMLPGFGNRLKSLMHCVQMGWMCTLVGPPASGKTSLVRLLARLTGNNLHEFALSSATETTELLGCFEQHDVFRHWQDLVKRVHASLELICVRWLSDSMAHVRLDRKLELVKSLLSSWAGFQKCLRSRFQADSLANLGKEREKLDPMMVDMLLQTAIHLEKTGNVLGMPEVTERLRPSHLLDALQALTETLNHKKQTLGHFEWIDGGLLKAIEDGDWVLLENANFCNPTVLDRLNPLLEPDGTILVNERGLVNGSAMIVRAHPNFRLFLSVNPSHGELSRSMRNRGIEIFMMQPDWMDPSVQGTEPISVQNEGMYQDAHQLLVHAAVPSLSLTKAMFSAHEVVRSFTESLPGGINVSLRELAHWITLMQQLIARGANLPWSLACSWVQTYVRHLGNEDVRQAALDILDAQMKGVGFFDGNIWDETCLYVPGGWPRPCTLELYCMKSTEACVKRDAMYLEFLVADCFALKASNEWQSRLQAGADPKKQSSWLQDQTNSLAYFPKSLLQIFLNPLTPIRQAKSTSSQSVQNGLTKLRYAALWMAARGSISDMELRIQWLAHCAGFTDVARQAFSSIILVLKKEAQHGLFKELCTALENIKAMEGSNLAVEHFPFASQGALVSLNENFNGEPSDGMKTEWRKVSLLGGKLLSLRRCLLQWELEDEAVTLGGAQGGGSYASPVMQSYRHHTSGALRMRSGFSTQIPKMILRYAYFLFKKMRAFENEILTKADDHLWENGLEGALRRLQEWHAALWRVLDRPTFDIERFLFDWAQTKKCLVEVMQSAADASTGIRKLTEDLEEVVRVWDEAHHLGESSRLKPLLWKHGGHPLLLNSKELCDQEHRILTLCESLWEMTSQEGRELSFCKDVELRRSVMEGMSMSSWLRQHTADDRTKLVDCMSKTDVHLKCGEIFTILLQRLDIQRSSRADVHEEDIPFSSKSIEGTKGQLAGCRCSNHHQNDELAAGSLANLPGFHSFWVNISTWLDFLSTLTDTALLEKISTAFIFRMDNRDPAKAVKQQGLGSNSMRDALEFSLTSSTRSPIDFVPHQQVLWILDTGPLITSDFCANYPNIMEEMWFRWHQALWRKEHKQVDRLTHGWTVEEEIPPRFFQAFQSITLSKRFGGTCGPVKDYEAELVQLRIYIMHMWNSQKKRFPDASVSSISNASALFVQMILAYKKSFPTDIFAQVSHELLALQKKLMMTCDDESGHLHQHEHGGVERLNALLGQSNHTRLVATLHLFVLPCASSLYCTAWKTLSTTAALLLQGRLWLLIGLMRLQLLLPVDGCDPVAKYNYRHIHAADQLADLNLDIEVRRKSELTIGGSGRSTEIGEMESRACDLQRDLAAMSLKIIPRPQPPKFRDFCQEVLQFMELSANSERLTGLWNSLKEVVLSEVNLKSKIHEAAIWQENADNFIHRLAKRFADYRDFVQPVQHAVYELKFGLSLSVTASLQLQTLHSGRVQQNYMALRDLITQLMEYPSQHHFELPSKKGSDRSLDKTTAANLLTESTEQIVSWTASLQDSTIVPEEVLKMEMKVGLLRITLWKVGQKMLRSSAMSEADLTLLGSIFSSLSALWSKIREYRVDQKKEEDEGLRFSTSTHTMDVEATLDEDEFKSMFPDYHAEIGGDEDNDQMRSAEEDDRRAEEALLRSGKEITMAEKVWARIEEGLFEDVTYIHQCLFGASKLLQLEESWDKDTLHCFRLSYEIGRQLLQVVGHCVPASVDERLLPAHLMRSNLEYQSLVGGSRNQDSASKADIYSGCQPSEIALMLDPIRNFLKRIVDILKEWPEHPILQQLLHISKTLLSFSLNTVLMKALTGVELLLSKAQLWEENAARHVSIAGELNGLSQLVTRWRKLELEGWSNLLKRKEKDHVASAQKMWFSLYGVLHRPVEKDNSESYLEATVSSIEEFMQTSTFGDYRTRLQLVQQFYGHLSVHSRVQTSSDGPPLQVEEIPSSAQRNTVVGVMEKSSHILYNLFKYYSQFLHLLDEILEAEKSAIKKELEEVVKLAKWDDRSHYTLTLSAEKSHRKLHKIVKKYDVLLKRSASELFGKMSQRMGTSDLSSAGSTGLKAATAGDHSEIGAVLRNGDKKAVKISELSLEEWRRACDAKVSKLGYPYNASPEVHPTAGKYQKRLPELASKIGIFLGTSVFSEASSKSREVGVDSVEMLSTSVIIRAAELRQGEKRISVKKKALIDLLKALRQIGLSHHKSAVPKRQRGVQSWLQLPPAEACRGLEGMACPAGERPLADVVDTLVTSASDYYYKNMALLQNLQRSALNFSKDLSLREVDIMTRYTEHLLYLQQVQRGKVDEFGSTLSLLGSLIQSLSCCGSEGTVLPNQGFVRKWMQHQKLLFDSLQQAVSESLLLFESSESIQLCPANPMRVEAGAVKTILRELLVGVNTCKSRLDGHLRPTSTRERLGNCQLTWPLLYTPGMLEDLSANFHSLGEIIAAFGRLLEDEKTKAIAHLTGLQPLQQLLLKGNQMVKEFELETHQDVGRPETNMPDVMPDVSSQFTHRYEEVISETLLAVQKIREGRFEDVERRLDDAEETMVEDLKLEWNLKACEEAIRDKIECLRLTSIGSLVQQIFAVSEALVDDHGKRGDLAVTLGRLLNSIHVPLEMIHAAGARLLSDYISLHRSVTKLSYILSNLFISLCADGFCAAKEEEGQEGDTKSGDASGTGMGEGEGKKDVSEQIEDEEQLMGGMEKEQDDVPETEAGNKAQKGIEMEQDFSGDMMNLSEDDPDQDDEDDEEDEKLESKMGEHDDEDEIVDEKMWDNKDDANEKPDSKEKYEKDSAISGAKSEDLEMRGKEDEETDKDGGEKGEQADRPTGKDETNEQSDQPLDSQDDAEEEIQNNKDESVEDKSGLKPSAEEALDFPESLDLDDDEEGTDEEQENAGTSSDNELEGNKATGDTDPPAAMNVDEDISQGQDEEQPGGGDLNSDEGADEEMGTDMDVDQQPSSMEADAEDGKASSPNTDNQGSSQEENVGNPEEERGEQLGPQSTDAKPSAEASSVAGIGGKASQADTEESELEENARTGPLSEDKPAAGMDQSSLEMTMDGEKRMPLTKPPTSTENVRNTSRPDVNPYRSLGDSLKRWKEQVRVVDGIEGASVIEGSEDPVGEVASPELQETGVEYEFVGREEQGSAQALGSATKDQLEESNEIEAAPIQQETAEDGTQPEDDTPAPQREEILDKVEERQMYANHRKNRSGNLKPSTGDESNDNEDDSDLQQDIGALGLEDASDQAKSSADMSVVSLQRHPQTAPHEISGEPSAAQFEPWTEEEITRTRKELERELMESAGNREAARSIWQKYEHLTARLSHELAEQLRLILEPTLAARLQGDYRTGKRINMKKIIPYIASSFRKDKIWLRRTKANKRQYQVVVAIDDSRSMSESHCAHLAVEALITICRAMSHMEIGQMAVASFGQKGNVHLLHDFDQPFSDEAAINMVSRFSFSQDNTLADQPMVDLLQFLTRILDMAAASAVPPSGNVVLQQLVLIIADGRFHEKESLRRCIREATSRRQLLALIVLDNPQESILDMQSVSFSSGAPEFSKYLDSFPFPYYILLRDIESLPRTLADLMRQWFELTQRTSGQ